MTLLCDALLVVALLITLILPTLILSMRKLSGPDRAGAGIGFFMVGIPRWICLGIVLSVLSARGEFAWVTNSRGMAWLVVIVSHACIGGCMMAILMMAGERDDSNLGRARGLLTPLPILLALLLIVYLLVLLHSDSNPIFFRILFTICAGISLIAALITGLVVIRSKLDRMNQQIEQQSAEDQERLIERTKAFDALPPDGPLTNILVFAVRNEPEPVHLRALEAISKRSNLTNELVELLGNDWRGEAIAYVRHHVPTPPPPALAAPAREALLKNAESLKQKLSPILYVREDDYTWDCLEAIAVADKMHQVGGVDFRPVIEAFVDAIASSPNKVAVQGRRELAFWLKHHE